MAVILKKNYQSTLDIKKTQMAIKQIKDFFESKLLESLKLTRVSAPFFVFPETGLNDNLSGVERPVQFEVKSLGGRKVEIVHSLAKWKRAALKKYGFSSGEGIYTDMNAIRRDEDLDNIHSIYVDQWDWELAIDKSERNVETLKNIVNKIYGCFKASEKYICDIYPELKKILPETITFLTSQELEDMFPQLSAKERENKICKKHGAVFLMQIGGNLKSGQKHDVRSPDYDDWNLNGDMLFYYPVLETGFEVMSMGIRVDEESLVSQLKEAEVMERLSLPFHKSLYSGELPYSVGGGLGQSRICMFLLQKAHIGEVQASIWPEELIAECEEANIHLL